eukprot:TRINITY_DN10353_c1_g1_i1.p1 TRINITY_DN10353_c1_g1~~TRINITY_DN10353_c1_g1_i1.p1  ORF type:complete len:199 (+),score=32.69 TRINITY_DN10353_c1_g1_i1:56-652(+)
MQDVKDHVDYNLGHQWDQYWIPKKTLPQRIDLPLDHLSKENLEAIEFCPDFSFFLYRNIEAYKTEYQKLLPKELRAADPRNPEAPMHGWAIRFPERPIFQAVLFGSAMAGMVNYWTLQRWHKVPWRFPLYVALTFPVVGMLNAIARRNLYTSRKEHLIANNYLNRSRAAIVERTKRNGGNTAFTDVPAYSVWQRLKGF